MPFHTLTQLGPLRPLCALALLIAFMGSESVQAQASRPNVIHVVFDDLNHYAWASDNRDQDLPNMKRLADSGVRFDRCYANSPLCGPSRVSFMTGRDPVQTGVSRNFIDPTFRQYFDANGQVVTTIPEHLKANGYYTVGINKLFHGFQKTFFDNDFDAAEPDPMLRDLSWNEFYLYNDLALPTVESGQSFPGTGYGWSRVQNAAEANMADAQAAQKAVEVLADYAENPGNYGNKPLMLSIGFIKPHVPHKVPARYFPNAYEGDLVNASIPSYLSGANPSGHPLPDYGPDGQQGSFEALPTAAQAMALANGAHQVTADSFGITNAGTAVLGPNALAASLMANANMAYIASGRFADAQLGVVLDALDSLGLSDSTIIVVHSDHGFSQGEHKHWAKRSMWEDDTRVPFVVRDPRKLGGIRVDDPVSLLDLFPSLCNMIGIPEPSFPEDSNYLHGRDIMPLAAGPLPPRPVRSVVSFENQDNTISCADGKSLFWNEWHYIELTYSPFESCHPDSTEVQRLLYNLESDPDEWDNRIDDPQLGLFVDYLEGLLNDSLMENQASAQILTLAPDTLLSTDPGYFYKALLTTAEGDSIFAPPGTGYSWALDDAPGVLKSGNKVFLNPSILPSSFYDDGRTRLFVAWVDYATSEILSLTSLTIGLEQVVIPPRPAGPQSGTDCQSRFADLNGRWIAQPRNGQIVVDACGRLLRWNPSMQP